MGPVLGCIRLLNEIGAQGLGTLLCSLSLGWGSYLSMPCAARQAVLSASFTCASQRQPSSLLSQRSMLCSRSPQASTRRTKLSCRGRPLHKCESCHPSLSLNSGEHNLRTNAPDPRRRHSTQDTLRSPPNLMEMIQYPYLMYPYPSQSDGGDPRPFGKTYSVGGHRIT